MANEPTTPDPELPSGPPPGMISLTDLGQVIGDAVARGISANTRKKVTFGEYDPKSPFQKGLPKNQVPKLRRECYQNGAHIDQTKLFPNEITLLNALDRSGRYINRMVEVIVREDGVDEVVEVRFNNRTTSQQLELKGYAKSFEDMLQQIVDANKAADAVEAERDLERATRPPGNGGANRKFGAKGAAFQEARA